MTALYDDLRACVCAHECSHSILCMHMFALLLCVHIHVYAACGHLLIVAAMLQSFTSIMVDYSTVARAQVKYYLYGALYLHFGSWNLSDRRAGFIFVTCVWFQSKTGIR